MKINQGGDIRETKKGTQRALLGDPEVGREDKGTPAPTQEKTDARNPGDLLREEDRVSASILPALPPSHKPINIHGVDPHSARLSKKYSLHSINFLYTYFFFHETNVIIVVSSTFRFQY